MDVAVVIVSYKSTADILNCLDALFRSTYERFRVVICENGGPDAFAALRQALRERAYGPGRIDLHLAEGNLGFAGGVNLGLAKAGPADAYWILNPDTEPYPDTLASLVHRLQQGDCDAVGHDILLLAGHLANRGGGRWLPLTAQAISIDHGRPREPRPTPETVQARMNYIIGASMLVTQRFVTVAGPMREDYFLYCEEVDWCLRAQTYGLKLGYDPNAVVLHMHGTSTGGGGPLRERSRLSIYLIERNRLLLTRDLYPNVLPVAAVMALAHLTLKFAKGRAWAQLGYAVDGWRAGMRNERGPPKWVGQQ